MINKILQRGGFLPEIFESGLLADFCDSLGMNPQAIDAFGGHVGMFAGELALALPICCLENGCVLPFSIRLVGWYVTRDGDFWKPIHATGGGALRGGIGTWRRMLSPDCRQINVFCSLRDAMTAETLDPAEGHFCFLRPPDAVDFPFLMALDGMSFRIIFTPLKSNLPWTRAWLKYAKEVGQAKAIPLPQAALAESLELK